MGVAEACGGGGGTVGGCGRSMRWGKGEQKTGLKHGGVECID